MGNRIRAAQIFGVTVGLILMSAGIAHARDLGVDVSHFQDEAGVAQARWDQLYAEGRRFAFIKSTEGLLPPGNTDATMATNVARAATAGIIPGVYHYAHPENRPTLLGAQQEANHFVNYSGNAIGPGRLRPALDIEGSAYTLTDTALTDWVIAFCDEVIALRGPEAEPIIYTTSPSVEFTPAIAGYDLWIRSVTGADPQTGNPASGDFGNWTVWQYAVAPAGGINPVDQNVIHSEYKTLASLVTTPEPASAMSLLFAAVLTMSRRRA